MWALKRWKNMQHDDTTIATSNCDIENNKRQIEKEGMFFLLFCGSEYLMWRKY